MAEFRNPNAAGPGGGGPQDNRSLLLMMVVMFGVIFGLQIWRAKHNPQTASPAAPVAQTTAAAQPAAPLGSAGTGTFPTANPATGTTPSVATMPTVQAAAEATTVVENDLYRITFSNRGAQAVSWILKKYTDNEGKPLDLVHDGAAKQFGFPLSLYAYDSGMTTGLAQALYVPSSTGTLNAPGSLTFHYAAGNVVVQKTFSFDNTYAIHADTLVTQNGAPVRTLLAWPAGFGDAENALAYAGAQVDTMSGGKEDHESFKKISSGNTLNGPFDWAGVSDQYFAAIFLPDSVQGASLATFHHEIDVNKVQRSLSPGQGIPVKPNAKPILVPVLGTALGDASGHTLTRLFVGPKAVNVLGTVQSSSGETLKPLLDFGFFGPIGKYLFLALRAIHSAIAPAANSAIAFTKYNRSWGWAIILLTITINLVLLPLRVQGMKSMLKMQRIQPELDKIKARYKNPKATDPKAAEMNAEIMAYQKTQGVSMFGGCVPMLIQLPLLFAFFSMLTKVVELRQAHFFWLPDLSAADPYHILPILMLITSFVVQYYTPSPGVDPQQQKMMAFMMPAFSMYMTWNYASGLAIYWVTGNLIMMAQQAITNRTAMGRELREIAAQRAKLKATTGTGMGVAPRTIQGRR